MDRDGNILISNRIATATLFPGAGENGADVKRPFWELLPPSAAEAAKSAIGQCRSRGSSVEADIQTQGEGGTGKTLRISFSPLGAEGQGAGPDGGAPVVAVGRDISDEKRKELDFLRFSNLAHHTVNPLEITDTEGRIIYVNPAFEKASGYTAAELIGKNPNIFSSGKHPAIFWKKMWETIKGGKVWTGEIENRKRNGELFHAQLLISPILDADGTVVGYFGIHRDITEQKSLEKHLMQAQKMESMGLLTAGIAHEVGNPLTSISSIVQVHSS